MATREQQHATTTLRLRRAFPAPPERVFRAWTTPAEMKQWTAPGAMTPVAEVDLRPGGRYRIHMRAPDGAEHHLVGGYRVVDPPKKLVYTWRWENSPEAPETLVTVEFIDRGGRPSSCSPTNCSPTKRRGSGTNPAGTAAWRSSGGWSRHVSGGPDGETLLQTATFPAAPERHERPDPAQFNVRGYLSGRTLTVVPGRLIVQT